MAPVKTMKTKKEFQKLLREASEGSSSSSASSSPWLTYGKYLVVLFIGSVLLGYLMGDGLIQTQVDKQFNLTVAGHSCQQVWQSLKSFQ